MIQKQHIIIDAKECVGDLTSREKLWSDIKELVKRINMDLLKTFPYNKKQVINPYVVSASKDEPPGVSGNAIITTSNITIHTWSDDKLVNVDVFSCKPFNKNEIKKFIKETYKTNKIKIETVKRW